MSESSTPMVPAAYGCHGHGATLPDLPGAAAPALVFESVTGAVVPLRRSGRLATLDVDAPLIGARSVRFFRGHAPSPTAPAGPAQPK